MLPDSIVVLRGTVTSDDDRRLAEGIVRLEPGVRVVRNELQLAGGVARQP
jgi:osmotically-inducible protein OsmY